MEDDKKVVGAEAPGNVRKHLRSCIIVFFKQSCAREDYEDENPYFCEICEGWGYVHYLPDVELSLLRDAPKEVFSKQFCQCVIKGTCPRCGTEEGLEDDECTECGFELGKTEGMPHAATCTCTP